MGFESEILNLESEIWNLEFRALNPEPRTLSFILYPLTFNFYFQARACFSIKFIRLNSCYTEGYMNIWKG